MRLTATILLAGVLCVGIAAAQDTTTTTSSQSGVKQDMKDAGHGTKTAAKDVGHGTKKVVHKGASKTEEGSQKVKNRTVPQ